METKLIVQRLARIEKILNGQKTIFNIEDLMDYSGYSRSYIYKLVHRNEIPFSKPGGKNLFFEKEKIDYWLLSNQSKTKKEIQQQAEKYVFTKKA